jgi:hypothetical protein
MSEPMGSSGPGKVCLVWVDVRERNEAKEEVR